MAWSSRASSNGNEFSQLLNNAKREPLHIGDNSKPISAIAWCTGGAQDYIDQAAQMGVDAFISGEVSERTYRATAMEQGIHYFAAGHRATEPWCWD
ncbi:Nif3-like dinuclear metal center hexameric protein [Paucibacter sp. O1-1]|nr:Nif3-like dinuclear metal center hexameric protein [Paucibacter sp. O1-1]